MAAGRVAEIDEERDEQEAEACLYRCTRCKRQITLFVPATVTCSRCGRVMRPVAES